MLEKRLKQVVKIRRCINCHTINGDFHNGCQCDLCDGYVIQEDIKQEDIEKYKKKWDKKRKEWDKVHTIYVKEKQ